MSQERTNSTNTLFYRALSNTLYAIFLLLGVLALGACCDSGPPAPPNEPDVAGSLQPVETSLFDGGYKLKIPNGRYRVTLKFCEPHFNASGKRICDVKLQGKIVIEKLDIFAEAGQFAARDYTFDDIHVKEGHSVRALLATMSCKFG